jgi:two-component system sensor histidine kinase/response regulator
MVSLNVLVVDDSPVNQKILVRMLERACHCTTTASNGQEAVALVEQHAFDLVLMDVQMPGMDGLQATAAIRARERVRGGHVQIIAVTTNGSPGDREICLAAGMDAHVPKPVDRQILFDTIGQVQAPCSGPGATPPSAALLDRTAALQRVGGDEEMLRELVQIFREESPRTLHALCDSFDRGNAPGVKLHAHTFKGSLAFFGAEQALAWAHRLETMGRHGDLSQAGAALGGLKDALRQLQPALDEITYPTTVG